MQKANEKRLYRLVFDEIHKVITDIGYRDAFNLFPRLNLAGVTIFGSSASIPPHLLLALFQLTQTPWKVIRTPSNRKELVYQVQSVPQDVDLPNHILNFWNSIKPTYGPLDRCLLFCRTKDEAKVFGDLLNVLPFHSECEDDSAVERFRAGEQKILPTTVRLGCGFHYEHIRHVLHADLAYSVIDQYQEDSRGGRDGKPCYAITFVPQNRPCPPDKGVYDIGVQAVWEWSRKGEQCLRIIPSLFLDGVSVTCDLVPGAQLCVYCQTLRSQNPPPQPSLMPVQANLRLSEAHSTVVQPLYGLPPHILHQPVNRTAYKPPPSYLTTPVNRTSFHPPSSTLSTPAFKAPLNRAMVASSPSVLDSSPPNFSSMDETSPGTQNQSPHPLPTTFTDTPSPGPMNPTKKRIYLDPSMIFFTPQKRPKSMADRDQETGQPVSRYLILINLIIHGIFTSKSLSVSSVIDDPFITNPSPVTPRPTFGISRPSGRVRSGFGPALASNEAFDHENEWNEKVNIPLRKVINFFLSSCIGCFFGKHPELFKEHRTEFCPVSKLLMGYNEDLKSFRSKFDLPHGHCYGCGLTTKVRL